MTENTEGEKSPTVEPVGKEELEYIAATRGRSSELERAEDDRSSRPDDMPNIPGVRILRSILGSTVFTDLFCHQAHTRFLHPRPEERVAAMIDLHPRFYKWCRAADLVARAVVFVAVVGVLTFAAVAAIWKSFLS